MVKIFRTNAALKNREHDVQRDLEVSYFETNQFIAGL